MNSLGREEPHDVGLNTLVIRRLSYSQKATEESNRLVSSTIRPDGRSGKGLRHKHKQALVKPQIWIGAGSSPKTTSLAQPPRPTVSRETWGAQGSVSPRVCPRRGATPGQGNRQTLRRVVTGTGVTWSLCDVLALKLTPRNVMFLS